MTKETARQLKVDLFDNIEPQDGLERILGIVDKYAEPVKEPLKEIDLIQKHFYSIMSVEELFHNLEHDPNAWTKQKLAALEKCSPLSLKVVVEQLKRGANLSLEDALSMEYTISQNFMQGTEGFEGIRAHLVDKDKNPKW